jgi:hypothetical protein
MMMRRPEFLMMRRPCAALRRPENPDRSASILLLPLLQNLAVLHCKFKTFNTKSEERSCGYNF